MPINQLHENLMKPQVTIQEVKLSDKTFFTLTVDENGQTDKLNQEFASYSECLTFISDKDWQVKRDEPESLHIPTQFMKP